MRRNASTARTTRSRSLIGQKNAQVLSLATKVLRPLLHKVSFPQSTTEREGKDCACAVGTRPRTTDPLTRDCDNRYRNSACQHINVTKCLAQDSIASRLSKVTLQNSVEAHSSLKSYMQTWHLFLLLWSEDCWFASAAPLTTADKS